MTINKESNEKTSLLPGLNNLRVAITAGANGIGLAISRFLNTQGVKLAICDIDDQALGAAKKELPQCLAIKTDVSNPDEVDSFFRTIQAELGGLNVLINNAGIAGPTGKIEDISTEEWKQCIDINLTGQFLCAKHAIPMIKKAGGGSIINMSSVAGKYGYAFRTPYSSSKFGIIGLTQSLAKELGADNIRVNAILPGIVEGPRIDNVIRNRAKQVGVSYEEMKNQYLKNISLKRMVTMGDVATTIAFLLSDFGCNISGQSLAVDGNVETL